LFGLLTALPEIVGAEGNDIPCVETQPTFEIFCWECVFPYR
jgi:hypothetical protein